MDQVTKLRTLYLDMMQRCIINTIYEDPNQSYWSPPVFDGKLRELGRDWPSQAHSMIGGLRMSNLRQITEFVVANHIPGDFIETGVWRGGACIMARAVFKAYGAGDRRVCGRFLLWPSPTRPQIRRRCQRQPPHLRGIGDIARGSESELRQVWSARRPGGFPEGMVLGN